MIGLLYPNGWPIWPVGVCMVVIGAVFFPQYEPFSHDQIVAALGFFAGIGAVIFDIRRIHQRRRRRDETVDEES
jgi:hypothetical protein